MANIAKLRKTLGRIDGLRPAADLSYSEDINLHELNILREDVWDQERWFTAATGVEGKAHRECTITERGVMYDDQPCYTTGCFAGWTLIDFAPAGTTMRGRWVTLPDGEFITVQDFAQREHELTTGEADRLFNGDNTLEELHAIVDQFEAAQEE
jgi:hypothetical protein